MRKDLTGKVFGKLTVLSVVSKTRNGHIRWLCDCSCGKTHEVLSTHLISNKITHCGCEKRSGTKHRDWSGCGDISGDYFNSLQRKSRGSSHRQKLEFSVSIEFLWALFLKQNRKCALSGLELHFTHSDGIRVRNSKSASLDRIDSSIGYVEGNVQWVHKDINLMKNRLNQNLFLNYCKLIMEKNNETT